MKNNGSHGRMKHNMAFCKNAITSCGMNYSIAQEAQINAITVSCNVVICSGTLHLVLVGDLSFWHCSAVHATLIQCSFLL